jgi:hypothetical protein
MHVTPHPSRTIPLKSVGSWRSNWEAWLDPHRRSAVPPNGTYRMPRYASIAPRTRAPRSIRHRFRVATDPIRAGLKRMSNRESRPVVIGSPPAAGLSEWLRETEPVRAGRLGEASGT